MKNLNNFVNIAFKTPLRTVCEFVKTSVKKLYKKFISNVKQFLTDFGVILIGKFKFHNFNY